MDKTIAIILMTLAAGAAAAGPYDQPYCLVETGDNSEVRKEARASVTKVDGKSTNSTQRPEPIAPGKHVLTVSFSSARGNFRPDSQDLALELEPCVRYRAVAVYEANSGPDWKPKVHSEPIGECRKKFGMGK